MEVFAVDVGLFGGIFVRKVLFPAIGDYVSGHDHALDHITMVSQGRIRFRCPVTGIDRDIVAPDFIETPARARHEMTAVEPNSCAWCIFAVPDGDMTGTA